MKGKMMMFVIGLVGLIGLMGCAGVHYNTPVRDLGEGVKVVSVGRTGVFGVDSHADIILIEEQSSSQAAAMINNGGGSEVEYTLDSLSWTGCPDQKPNRRAKNIRRETKRETWKAAPKAAVAKATTGRTATVVAGTTASTGNAAIPVALGALGYIGGQAVRRPDSVNVIGTGGKSEAGAGSSSTAIGTGTGGNAAATIQ